MENERNYNYNMACSSSEEYYNDKENAEKIYFQ